MKKMTKSRDNKVFTGVLAGIGEYFSIDPSIIRVLFVLATLFSFGSPVLLYLLLVLLIPEAPSSMDGHGPTKSTGYYRSGQGKSKEPRRKEAEKVDNDDWSDF